MAENKSQDAPLVGHLFTFDVAGHPAEGIGLERDRLVHYFAMNKLLSHGTDLLEYKKMIERVTAQATISEDVVKIYGEKTEESADEERAAAAVDRMIAVLDTATAAIDAQLAELRRMRRSI